MVQQERRNTIRRGSDRALKHTVEILKLLDRMFKGQKVDFGEYYADLVGMRSSLGRREEDRALAEELCSALEALAADIQGLTGENKTLRRVRLTKMSGKRHAALDLQSCLVGWEESRPRVGSNYTVFKDEGGVFRSAVVIRVAEGEFQTRNSIYKVEILEERALPS
ncbi:MAG: hypothetical protein WHX93_00300 [bacterium]